MNYDRVSATIGTRAVDPRMLANDKFLKRMGNFERVFKQIDAKHDHVMEMLANIQEQLRTLEMKQRKERDAQFESQKATIKPPYLSVSRPQEFEVESRILPPNQRLSSLSYGSNDAKLEIEGFVEVLKPASIISTVAVETVSPTKNSTKIHERMVFDEMLESKKSKIRGILPPFVLGSEVTEVCDFSVSNPQSQMPLVSTQEIKMELDCLSLIPSPSSFSLNSNGTKLEDEGFVELPIHITVTESQLQESESEFESSENSPVFSLPEFIPSWKIMVSSLLHLPLLYKCYGVEVLTKEELIWFDTGQHRITSGLSRERVTSNFIVSWNSSNEMYQNKNILVSEMQLKDSWSEWGEIKIVVRGAKNCEQNSGALRIHELVDCVSLYMMNFTCLAFAYDPGIYCICWNESLVHFLKDSWGDVLVLEVNELIRAAHEEQLKAEPRRRMMESFKNGVNEVLYKLRADVGSSAQRILAGGNNLIAMFTGGYKGSFNNNSQTDKSNGSICSFVSQNNLLKCSRMNREKVLCIVTSKSNTLGLVGCNICWFQTICLVLCFKNLSSVTPHARTRRICFYTFMELAVGKWLKDGNRTCLQIDSLPIARLCEICDGLFEMFPTWNKNLGSDNLEKIIDDCRVAKYFLELQFEMGNSRAVFHLICLINLELKKLIPLKTLLWLDWLLSAFRSQIYPEVYRIFHSPDLASLITLDFESLKGGSSSLISFSNVFIGCSGSFGETIISTSIEAKGQGVAVEFIISFGSRELNVGVGMMTESLIKQIGDHSTMSRVNKVDKMLDRPSAKPPFQFRHLSLGDKTLSRGEYCHGNGWFCTRRILI